MLPEALLLLYTFRFIPFLTSALKVLKHLFS